MVTKTISRSTSLLLVIVACGSAAVAETCLPIVTTPINLDGAIVGSAVTTVGTTTGCMPDPGWRGVADQKFAVFGEPGLTSDARILLAGYKATTSSTLEKIYIGVHVEKDPELTEKDRIVLYFDANPTTPVADSFDAGDFALLYEVGTQMPQTTDTCPNMGSQMVGRQEFYLYQSGFWTPRPFPTTSIRSRVIWDYDPANDNESEIWELEIEIDVAGMGITAPANGAGFRIGAKLYVLEFGDSQVKTYLWPPDLTMNPSAASFDPNDGGVTPDKLAPTTTTCGYDVSVVSISATAATGQANSFTIPTGGNFTNKNKFTASLKFFDPANPNVAGVPLILTNQGTASFRIRPYGDRGGNPGFISDTLMGSFPITFDKVPQELTVPDPGPLEWPRNAAEWDPVKQDFAQSSSDHACYMVALSGFNVNQDPSTDYAYMNLTYIRTSTVRDAFTVSARGYERPSGESTIEYILRVKWRNIPVSELSTASPIAPVITPVRGRWSYRFVNAAQIGLTDLGKGYFSMPLKIGEEKRVEISITGGRMPRGLARQRRLLSPRAGGRLLTPSSGDPPLEIKVVPGKIATIVAHGLIRVDPQNDRISANGPNGFSDRGRIKSAFLLKNSYFEPSQNVGALIGSFDKFQTAFVIGSDETFLIPQGATRLWLAVNDTAGDYRNNTGKGFELSITLSEPLFLPTRMADSGNPKLGIPPRMQAGSNLPQLDIDIYQAFPVQPGLKHVRPTAYVSYAIYDSHP